MRSQLQDLWWLLHRLLVTLRGLKLGGLRPNSIGFDSLRCFILTTPKANATTERAPNKEEAFPVDDFFFREVRVPCHKCPNVFDGQPATRLGSGPGAQITKSLCTSCICREAQNAVTLPYKSNIASKHSPGRHGIAWICISVSFNCTEDFGQWEESVLFYWPSPVSTCFNRFRFRSQKDPNTSTRRVETKTDHGNDDRTTAVPEGTVSLNCRATAGLQWLIQNSKQLWENDTTSWHLINLMPDDFRWIA